MAVFLKSLKQSGRLDKLHITVCNVGSRKIEPEDDYGSQGWGVFAPNLTIYGFDADPDACAVANTDIELRQKNGQVNWQEFHIPMGLGSFIGEAKLYVTKDRMCSSLYPPNESYLARFNGLAELVSLDFEIDIEITTLDDFCQVEGVNEIDYLQIDVQGADLDVLKGASWILGRSILAIQIELGFTPIYKGQPLFGEVDTFLKGNGFTLFGLSRNARYDRLNLPIHSISSFGALLWGAGFYLRDLLDQDIESLPKTPAQIFKLACIADTLGFSDYALELLKYLTINYGIDPFYNFADIIYKSLEQFPELVNSGISSLPIFTDLKSYLSPEFL
jgi:FkbM family methyltransferase